uniref:Cytochrome c oxidase subunit 2 n=1 Tax=Colletes gigas TaxID=935657 RepID=A0A0U1YG52_9HYME|nr:cytochrome c oxidase subunit II [Colletes gigas]
MSHWYMFTFQDPCSPYSNNLNLFYNITMIMMTIIISFTLMIMFDILMNKFMNRYLLKHHMIEIIWTMLPMLILMFIAFPSLKMLYFIDEPWNPIFFTIKSIGHQWYWSYEYPEFKNLNYDSYMIKDLDNMNLFRLLDVDNRMIIPFYIPIRLLTTSSDVIHSWTVPSLGVKMDSIPGRINQMTLISMRSGLFFGQCSEICGTNHSFMPISIESTNHKNFMLWLSFMNIY